jgi:LysM repeat protein
LEAHPGADSLVVTPKVYEMPAPAPTYSAKSSSARYHTVRSGESLWSISRKYNTSVEKIQRLNGMKGTLIRPGQRLRVR